METNCLSFAAILFFVSPIYNAKLPSYIEKCSLSDPELSDCLMDRTNTVIPKIINGSKEFHLSTLSPYHIDNIAITLAGNFVLKLIHIDLYGLGNVAPVVFDHTLERTILNLTLSNATIEGQYDINGKVMFVPITGNGPLNIDIANGTLNFIFYWDIQNSSNGERYLHLKNIYLDHRIRNLHFYFGNLFNGDKRLGEQMNTFINENFKDFVDDLRPLVADIIKKVIGGLLSSVTQEFSIEDLFNP